MKSEKLYAAIGAAEDDLLLRLEAVPQRQHRWRKWGAAAAACLCLITAGAFLVQRAQDLPANSKVISSFTPDADGVPSSIYAVPKPGTWFAFMDVQAALEAYAGQDVRYLLGFHIFPEENAPHTDEDALIRTELERLRGLGFDVGYLEFWTYRDKGAREYQHVSAGYFTAEQLEHFPASPAYGYAFFFITNGDGKPAAAEEGLITDYRSGTGFHSTP